jgi:hypothetical protein
LSQKNLASDTENAAFQLADNAVKSFNQKVYVGGIIFDLSKV